MVAVRIPMLEGVVVRHGRNMVLPVLLLLGVHAVACTRTRLSTQAFSIIDTGISLL